MRTYTPKLHYQKVFWKLPKVNKLKCNTDGACRRNPGWNSISLCIKNGERELVYARSQGVGWRTNMEAEARGSINVLLGKRFNRGQLRDRFTKSS